MLLPYERAVIAAEHDKEERARKKARMAHRERILQGQERAVAAAREAERKQARRARDRERAATNSIFRQ